ncbi:hypothetical protein UlMin_039125 [Ulmus minor]
METFSLEPPYIVAKSLLDAIKVTRETKEDVPVTGSLWRGGGCRQGGLGTTAIAACLLISSASAAGVISSIIYLIIHMITHFLPIRPRSPIYLWRGALGILKWMLLNHASHFINIMVGQCLSYLVTDVADALILNRLFGRLFSNGVILVSTSNRALEKFYEGGLQRDLFLPFIATLKERCVVHKIGSSTDYCKLTSIISYEILVSILLAKIFLLEKAVPQEVEVVMGRKLQVPLGADGCAYFPFEELCDSPLGAADYFGLFNEFHTLALDGVPIFGLHNRTAAYRFVTLVDVMYENKARLLCIAEGSPLQLFEIHKPLCSQEKMMNDLCVDNELGFAKDRTISSVTNSDDKEYYQCKGLQ